MPEYSLKAESFQEVSPEQKERESRNIWSGQNSLAEYASDICGEIPSHQESWFSACCDLCTIPIFIPSSRLLHCWKGKKKESKGIRFLNGFLIPWKESVSVRIRTLQIKTAFMHITGMFQRSSCLKILNIHFMIHTAKAVFLVLFLFNFPGFRNLIPVNEWQRDSGSENFL